MCLISRALWTLTTVQQDANVLENRPLQYLPAIDGPKGGPTWFIAQPAIYL